MTPSCGGNDMDSVGDDASGGEGSGGLFTALLLQFRLPGDRTTTRVGIATWQAVTPAANEPVTGRPSPAAAAMHALADRCQEQEGYMYK
jgi:hypothetical protein